MRVVTIPEPFDNGRLFESSVDHAYTTLRKHRESLANGTPLEAAPAARYACGFPLPPFQRELKWTREQEIRFVESIFLLLPVGSYTINEFDCDIKGNATAYSGWLIDGQQRLTTLERYFDNEFQVFGGYFSDLTPPQRRRFLGRKFTHYQVKLHDEEKIKDLYMRMAFGGTPHTDAERV